MPPRGAPSKTPFQSGKDSDRPPRKSTPDKRKRDAKDEELEAANNPGSPTKKPVRESGDKQDASVHQEVATEGNNDEQSEKKAILKAEDWKEDNEEIQRKITELQNTITDALDKMKDEKAMKEFAQFLAEAIGPMEEAARILSESLSKDPRKD